MTDEPTGPEVALREALRTTFARAVLDHYQSGIPTTILYGDAPTRLIRALRDEGYDVASLDTLQPITEAEAVLILRYKQTLPDVCLRCCQPNHVGLCDGGAPL